MSIQRFDCTNGGAQFCQGCYQMEQDSDGEYVRYVDHAAEIARLTVLAHHLRHCRECGENDVTECPAGLALWRAALEAP